MAEFRFALRCFLHFSETAAEGEGISAQQYQLLQVVGALPAAERASISTLAERMILRHHSAVELVNRAERVGLVTRVADPHDLRRAHVLLTEHGRAVLETLAAAHLQELQIAGPRMAAALETLFDAQTAGAAR